MILCLSCVVVFCTVYALILPAITLERKTVCGQEEHSHTEECYSSDGQLTCGKTEHTHTESCYADDKTSEDQSGEDPQQTPEQNQTEGQEQNQGQSQEQNQNQDQSQDQSQSQDQVQTSDDGNVAQNGENGDTAGTTEDETSGNDEESVVAGSTSAPAAEGEDGTGGTTTATEGFDLSKYTSKVESVSLYYQEKDENWKKIEENGSEEIPGDANIKLEVEYKDIQIQKLIQNHNCTLTYDLPDLLRNATPGGNIMEGSEIVGTLSISEGKIKVEFDQNYLEKKNNEGVTTIEGDFYITGEVNLSQLDKDGKQGCFMNYPWADLTYCILAITSLILFLIHWSCKKAQINSISLYRTFFQRYSFYIVNRDWLCLETHTVPAKRHCHKSSPSFLSLYLPDPSRTLPDAGCCMRIF